VGREKGVQDEDDGFGLFGGAVIAVDKEVENLTEVIVLVAEILRPMIGGVMEDGSSIEGRSVSVEGRTMSGVVNEAPLTAVDEAAKDFSMLLDPPSRLGICSSLSTCLSMRPILLEPGG
jgi:hypothetical protein